MIVMTETWLKEETKECYKIHNYSVMNDYLETLFIETDKEVVSNQNNMFVGIMCRPPGIDIFTINDELSTIGIRK